MARSTSPSAATSRDSRASARTPAASSRMPSSKLLRTHSASARSRGVRSVSASSASSRRTRSCWPDSTARSAARRRRLARRDGSVLSRADRSSAATAVRIPPRRCARQAAVSSSRAMLSSGRDAAAARCHARRSGTSRRTSASAACARCRSAGPAACAIAERTSGWRKVSSVPVTWISRAWTAASTSVSDSSPEASNASANEWLSFSAAVSRNSRVAGGSSDTRAENVCSSPRRQRQRRGPGCRARRARPR